ncbi:hypothetical protein Aperf_G00000089794 [Anoplocephala perfoliata]
MATLNAVQLNYLKNVVIPAILRSRSAYHFREPVDYEGLGLHDYTRIIKKPMDLGTISKKLKSNAYQSSEECIADLFLMLKNCYIYNAPGEEIVQMARTIEAIARRTLEKMPREETKILPRANLKRNHSSSKKGKAKGSSIVDDVREVQRGRCEGNLDIIKKAMRENRLDLVVNMLEECHRNLVDTMTAAINDCNELGTKIGNLLRFVHQKNYTSESGMVDLKKSELISNSSQKMENESGNVVDVASELPRSTKSRHADESESVAPKRKKLKSSDGSESSQLDKKHHNEQVDAAPSRGNVSELEELSMRGETKRESVSAKEGSVKGEGDNVNEEHISSDGRNPELNPDRSASGSSEEDDCNRYTADWL